MVFSSEQWMPAAILKLRQQASVARIQDQVLDGLDRPYNPTDPTDPAIVAERYKLVADLLDEVFLAWQHGADIPVGIVEAAESLAACIMGAGHDA